MIDVSRSYLASIARLPRSRVRLQFALDDTRELLGSTIEACQFRLGRRRVGSAGDITGVARPLEGTSLRHGVSAGGRFRDGAAERGRCGAASRDVQVSGPFNRRWRRGELKRDSDADAYGVSLCVDVFVYN